MVYLTVGFWKAQERHLSISKDLMARCTSPIGEAKPPKDMAVEREAHVKKDLLLRCFGFYGLKDRYAMICYKSNILF